MSEMSRMARRSMRAKIHRLTKGVEGKVDASDYGPEEVLNADVKTGARPISRRAFKKGGKVVAVTGKDAVKHAGKRPRRAEGGKAPTTPNSMINRNVKDANEEREGKKHIGAFKRGGRAHKAGGGKSWSEEAQKASKDLTQSTYGSGVPKEGYHPARGLANKLQREGVDTRASAPSQWEEMMSALPRNGGRKNPQNIYGGRKVTSEPEYKRGGRAKKAEGGKSTKGPRFYSDVNKVSETLPFKHDVNKYTARDAAKDYEGSRDHTLGNIKFNRRYSSEDATHNWIGTPMNDSMRESHKSALQNSRESLANLRVARKGMKDIGYKKGGRTKKAAGGAGVNADMGGKNFGVTGSSWDDDQKQAPKTAPKPQPRYVPTEEVDDAGPMPVRSGNKRGGNVTVASEKKLIKKAFREHENAEHGGKHEKLKLKRGGEALDGELQGTRPTGGRLAKADGGKVPSWYKQGQYVEGGTRKSLEMGAAARDAVKDLPHKKEKGVMVPVRTARASGGRTKGKTNIVIAIGRGHDQQPQGGMQPQPGMSQPPRSVPVAMPPQGPAAGAPMPMPYPVPAGAGAPPAGPMPMGRKRGGRAEYKLEDGAGGGKGRLEKIDWYGKK